MKHLLFSLAVVLTACSQPNDLTLYNANLEIAKTAISCYETPDFETLKSLIHADVEHQSPMYGQGIVNYDGVIGQAKFYMEGFKNVSFEDPIWLPGVDPETLATDGSVRVYGTWKGVSVETGNSFSVDAYHYFDVQDGLIIKSGDYFDATGMVNAVSAPAEVEVVQRNNSGAIPASDSE